MNLKLSIALLIVVLISTGITFSQPNYTDLNQQHWAYDAVSELSDLGVIGPAEHFGIGKEIRKTDYQIWLSRLITHVPFSQMTVKSFENEELGNLTRLEAIRLLISSMGFDSQAEQLKNASIPFSDVSDHKGYIKMALDFEIITLNDSGLFRPNSNMTREEAAIILYRLYQKYSNPMSQLMSYYAISSYDQASFSTHLTDLSYGWSRFEYDPYQTFILNTSSNNNNEYGFPQSYELAFKETLSDGTRPYLMIFVKDDSFFDSTLNKQVKLVESIIGSSKNRTRAINQILTELNAHSEFKGVLIDFETLKGETNSQNLNLFLNELRVAMEDSYKLITAVHPPRDNNQQYFDGYDYNYIGRVSDFVVLMAHDYNAKRLTDAEMASGLTITPLTPFNEIYYAIETVLDPVNGIKDSSKLILQLSMDTAQWKVVESAIVNSRPYNPTYSAVLNRLETGAIEDYSNRYQSPSIVFKEETDQSRNIVWYENTRSVQAKINLAKLFNLGGISIWRLGTIPNFDGTSLDIWHQILLNY